MVEGHSWVGVSRKGSNHTTPACAEGARCSVARKPDFQRFHLSIKVTSLNSKGLSSP